MTASTATTRKGIAAASLALVAVLAVPSSVSAETFCNPKSGICYYKPDQALAGGWPKKGYKPSYGDGGGYGNKFGGGWGYGAAALGGMAVGLVAAGAASANAGECHLVRRKAIDEDGNMYVRSVRVCE